MITDSFNLVRGEWLMQLRAGMVRFAASALFVIALIAGFSETGQAQVTVGAAVNGASFLNSGLPNGKLAQGVLFTVFGTGMGPNTLVGVSGFPLPTKLPNTAAGTSVTVTV